MTQETTVFVRFEHNLADFRAQVTSQLAGVTADLEGVSGRLGSVQVGENLVASFRGRVQELRALIRSSFNDLGREYQDAVRSAVGGPLALPGGQRLGPAAAGVSQAGIGELEALYSRFNTPELRQLFPNLAAEGKAAFQTLSTDLEGYNTRLRETVRESTATARGLGASVTSRQVYGSTDASGRVQAQSEAALARTGLSDIIVPTSQAEVQAALRTYSENTRRAAAASQQVAREEEELGVSLSEATTLAKFQLGGWRRVTNAVNAPFAHTNETTGETSYYAIAKKQAEDLFGLQEQEAALQKVTEPHVVQQYAAQEGLDPSTLKGRAAAEDRATKEQAAADAAVREATERDRMVGTLRRIQSGDSGYEQLSSSLFRVNGAFATTTQKGAGLTTDLTDGQTLAAQKAAQDKYYEQYLTTQKEFDARRIAEAKQAERELADIYVQNVRAGVPGYGKIGQFPQTPEGLATFTQGGRGLTTDLSAQKALQADAVSAPEEPISLQKLLTAGAGGFFGRGFNPGSKFNVAEALPNLISTAGVLTRYGALSTAIYGVTKALSDTKKQALDYIDSLTDISVALDTTRSRADSIVPSLEVFSRLAGSNVGASLDTAARGIRAFGEVGVDSTNKLQGIGIATAQISNQIAVITHKDLKDATGDVIAIASAYGITADHLSQVSDAVANAKQNLGGDPGQISQGLANFAQVANQSGISLQVAANLVSVIQAKTDQSGQAVATRLSRIVNVMQGAGAQSILKGLGVDTSTDIVTQFSQLKAELNKQDPSQAKAIESRLAGTANLREFTVALQESDRILEATGEKFAKAGAGQAQFDRLNRDLTATLRHLSGDLDNIRVNIARSGLLDIFGVAAREGESLAHVVSDLTQGFDELSHVIPNLGPVPLRSLAIMVAEIVLGYKAWQAVSGVLTRGQAALSETTGLLTQAVRNLAGATAEETAEETANVDAKDLTTKATLSEADARAVATEAINVETAAVERNNVARLSGMSILGGPGAFGKGAAAAEDAGAVGLAATAKSGMATVLTSVLGKVFIGLAALQIGDSVYNGLRDYSSKGSAADAATRSAQASFGAARTADEFTAAAKAWQEAAQKQANASSGLIGSAANLLEGNPHTTASKDAKAAAEQATTFAGELSDEQKAAAANSQVGVFQDLTSADGIKQGLDALTASGNSAAGMFSLLTRALDSTNEAARQGAAIILPGRAKQFSITAAQAAGAAFEPTVLDLTHHFSQMDLTDISVDSRDHPNEKSRQEYARFITDQYLLPGTKQTKLTSQTKSVIDQYLNDNGLTSGGELSQDQLNELINSKIIPIWVKAVKGHFNKDALAAWEKDFRTKLVAAISGQGDLGSLIVDQTTSAFVQQTLIAQAAQKAQDSQYGDAGKYATNYNALATARNDQARFHNGGANVYIGDDPRQTLARSLQTQATADQAGLTAASVGQDAVARARQKVADIIKAEQVAVDHGTGITEATAQSLLQANSELDSALEARAQSIAQYNISLISSDDTVARDQANVAELNRQAAHQLALGNPDAARDLRTKANDAANQLKKDKTSRDAALATDFINPNDALGVAQGQLNGDQIRLKSINKYSKDGKINQDWADAYAKVQQDKHALSQATLDQLTSSRLAAVDPRDQLGQIEAQLQNARAELAANPVGSTAYNNALQQIHSLQQQAVQYGVDLQKAQIEANVFPGSQLSAAAAKLKEAKIDLANALPGTKEWWQAYGALKQAQNDATQAELEYQHQVRLGKIDITDPVAVAREAVKEAKDKLAKDRKAGAPKDVIQADKNDVTSAQLSAQKAAFDQRFHDVQTAEQLGTMSHAAYIGWLHTQDTHLRAQIAGMKKTDAGYRQAVDELQTIDSALKSANDQFSGQFNLGDIKVPTPYEVRRQIAGGMGAAGTTVAPVTNNITIDGADFDKVKALIIAYLGQTATTRVSTAPRKS